MTNDGDAVADPRLRTIYQHWLSMRRGRGMPSPDDIVLQTLPPSVQPNAMILEVVQHSGSIRFRYRHVGEVFWRASGQEPVGKFVDEILPETAGYRRYVVGIYEEMARIRRPLYTENFFILRHGESDPMATKRVSLPLSRDGIGVDTVLAGHVFDYGAMTGDDAFSLVTGLKEGVRRVLG